MRSVIVFDLRSVTSHVKETCCIGMQTTLVDVRNLIGDVREILKDSIALRICNRRERERNRERERASCKRLCSKGCTVSQCNRLQLLQHRVAVTKGVLKTRPLWQQSSAIRLMSGASKMDL